MAPNLIKTLAEASFLNGFNVQQIFTLDDKTLKAKIPINHIRAKLESILSPLSIHLEQDIPAFHSINKPHETVKNIIAIASGKGGVGKSTVTYFLARALQKNGARVGILDADIYGPSQSLLFNLLDKPTIDMHNQFVPFSKHGIEVMSIGCLLSEEKALMWRGPMISQALNQLYTKTAWGKLDYLLIDLPPGTGDIPLTLSKKLALTSSLLVSQPHPLSHYDVTKCINLFQHIGIPIMGQIMNHCHPNSPYIDLNKNQIKPIFEIPYHTEYQTPNTPIDSTFTQLAHIVALNLAQNNVRPPNPFDNINIEVQQGEKR